MKIIAGLGNPGEKYKDTRHNLGFLIVEKLREYFLKKNITFSDFFFEKKFKAKIAQGKIKNETVFLVMPQTFMNNSGEAIVNLCQFYKLNPQKDILIIYDDIDLPLGKIRTKGKSAGGHHGMESIINYLGTQEIKRIRAGILIGSKKEIKDVSKFVLGKFTRHEKKIILEKILPQAIFEAEKFLKN